MIARPTLKDSSSWTLRPMKATTLEGQINHVASRGFRLTPQTLFDYWSFSNIGAVMEKCGVRADAADLPSRHEYRILERRGCRLFPSNVRL
jgi:hypothetical protein